ncbi:MAG: hypothetical protein H7Y59_13200 [Anaerolineales bacterium]|nr:hypothetical protein [Anaerolineales bacterium]
MLSGLNIPFSNTKSDSFSPEEEDGNYEVCIANISLAERRKRLNFAIIQFVIALIILAILLITGADKVWRLTLILPFGAAAASYFQWRDKT